MTATTTHRTTGLLSATAVVARRALLRFFRTPQEVIAGTATMAMFILIFLYVFGGEIDIPGLTYTNFLVPGYLTTAVLFTGMGTAAAVAEDLEQGVVDRIRSLPAPRLAFLTGRAAADTAVLTWSLLIATGVGIAVGFRPQGATTEIAAAAGLLLVYGFAFTWLFILLGLISGSAKGAQGLSFLVFPLTFVSSAYVRVDTLPAALRAFAEHQPLTVMIDTIRALTLGPAATNLLDHTTPGLVIRSLAWVIAILAISIPLALLRYRRT